MLLKKKKSSSQMALIKTVLGRLHGIEYALMKGGEPMLSMRLSTFVSDLKIAIESSEEMNIQL